MSKTKSKPPKRPPPKPLTYAEWRQRAGAMVGAPTAMREREWRNRFLLGETPEQAAEAAQRWAYNTGVVFARMNGGKKPRWSGCGDSMASDLDNGKEWSEMDLGDLRICLRLGLPIEEIAERLCRDVEEVEQRTKSLKEAEEVVTPIGEPLTLHRDSNLNYFDVISGGQVIGKILRRMNAPQDQAWVWVITGAFVAPAVPWRGFAATLSEAETAVAEHWRKWLALCAADRASLGRADHP
jgi:hypothetical protein